MLQYNAVYVDLDDTLVLHGRLNTRLVRFLYQAVNERKRLVLVTRHRGEPLAVLRRFRIDSLFDRVVHITDGSRKSLHIAGDMRLFSPIARSPPSASPPPTAPPSAATPPLPAEPPTLAVHATDHAATVAAEAAAGPAVESASWTAHESRSFGGIFIDDAFSERADVADTLRIPVFDCSMLDILLDERPALPPKSAARLPAPFMLSPSTEAPTLIKRTPRMAAFNAAAAGAGAAAAAAAAGDAATAAAASAASQ